MVGLVVANLLTASAGLAALVQDKIYPYAIDEDVDLPAVVYAVKSISPEYDKDCRNKDVNEVEIISFATTYKKCLEINEQVRLATELKSGLIAGIQVFSIRVSSITEGLDIDNNIYFSKLGITIKTK